MTINKAISTAKSSNIPFWMAKTMLLRGALVLAAAGMAAGSYFVDTPSAADDADSDFTPANAQRSYSAHATALHASLMANYNKIVPPSSTRKAQDASASGTTVWRAGI